MRSQPLSRVPGSPPAASSPAAPAEMERGRAGLAAGGAGLGLLLPHVDRHPLCQARAFAPMAPSLSVQVQLRCSVTVREPGSWQPPPPWRQHHLPPRRTRLARGTYLAKCAPGLSCIETLPSPCTRKRKGRASDSGAAGSQAPGEHK